MNEMCLEISTQYRSNHVLRRIWGGSSMKQLYPVYCMICESEVFSLVYPKMKNRRT